MANPFTHFVLSDNQVQNLANKKRKRVGKYDNTYYGSPLDRSETQENKNFPEKRKALDSIYTVYELVIQDIDRLFQSLGDADELDTSELRGNEEEEQDIDRRDEAEIGSDANEQESVIVSKSTRGKTSSLKEQQKREPFHGS